LPSSSVLESGEGKTSMAQHWEYLSWGAYVVAALGAWRYMPLAIVRLVAAFTSDERRHKQCMEVLRLARRDAARIPSYISAPSTDNKPHRGRASLSRQNGQRAAVTSGQRERSPV
jgi:hypothetical protein